MQKISFVQIIKGNKQQYEDAIKLWIPFINELDSNQNTITEQKEIILSLERRINIQGTRDTMHFEILYCDDDGIGLVNYAVDGGIKGLIEPGYGFCMGFYIKSEYRRKGYGRRMYEHMEKVLISHGVPYIYTCPDPVTGLPFWMAMGFTDSGIIDPDDKHPIYIKKVTTA